MLRLGLFGHLFHVGLVTFGIDWSTAFSSSLILACGPVFRLLLLRGLGVERLTRPQIVGVAVACAGVLIFLSDKLLGAAVTLLGVALAQFARRGDPARDVVSVGVVDGHAAREVSMETGRSVEACSPDRKCQHTTRC